MRLEAKVRQARSSAGRKQLEHLGAVGGEEERGGGGGVRESYSTRWELGGGEIERRVGGRAVGMVAA